MKITIKVTDQTYTVEVGDIRERPVLAVIDGEAFEVWPEEVVIAPPVTHTPAMPQPATPGSTSATGVNHGKIVRAPIPGVIISVAVKAGDVVKHGQELCVLEAMKMKNVIRANRAGTIGVVCTTAQQHVRHHDVLMEYTD